MSDTTTSRSSSATDSGTSGLGPLTLAALWFGASVSLAEIATGGLLADGGPVLGCAANLLGHLVGALFFFGAGWISWRRGRAAIAVSRDAFGKAGPSLFGLLNLVQLVGWTAVMIAAGARSLDQVAAGFFGFHGELLWRLVLGLLVFFWAVLGPRAIGKANTVAASALVVLCLLVSGLTILPLLTQAAPVSALHTASTAASAGGGTAAASRMSFGAGFELAVIMPLSWLPLVGDYIVGARRGRLSAWTSAVAYSIGSFWMYAIGFAAVVVAGTSDPAALMKGGWVFPALAVILLSTVTTAFLDARSGGISLTTAVPRIPERPAVAISAGAGLLLALAAPVEQYENFLLLIGSVFAPLYAVVFTDCVLRPRLAAEFPGRTAAAFVLWAAGVVSYRILSPNPTFLGTTVPVMGLVAGLYTLYALGAKRWKS